jgi:hypothetical protein
MSAIANRFAEGPERDARAVLERAPTENMNTSGLGPELLGQPRLTHPGGTKDSDEIATPIAPHTPEVAL